MGQYKLPGICAKCGVEHGTKPWTTTTTTTSISPWTLLGMFFGIGVTNRQTFTFTVPICDGCLSQYIQRETLRKRMQIGCFAIGIAGVLLWVFLAQSGQDNALALWIAIVAIITLGISFVRWWLEIKPGSFNGRYFKFRNTAFHSEFAKLNPELVKPSRRSQ
jgi:hypothetical protein